MGEAVAKAGAEDQSMEEILQSIRRIISEDDSAEGGEQTPTANGEAAAAPWDAASDSDILELTEVVVESAPPASGEDVLGDIDALLSGKAAPDEMFDDAPLEPPLSAMKIAPMPEPIAHPVHSPVQPDDASLVSPQTAQATAALFEKIKHPADHTFSAHSPSLATRSGTTVEDLLVETLRPILKEWLDANLPTMVERIIEREVRKISS